ncbi:MAG TPA: TIGR02530 family flagellar biosynthesis protein [Bacillota bacterium]|nr:TIGR02530 family flagellar biosynthesis protein [Bacillota bacterium]
MTFKINNSHVGPIDSQTTKRKQKPPARTDETTFQDALRQQISQKQKDPTKGIRLSAHASKRLIERNLTLNDGDIETLRDAMDRAEEKGARESLMLYKDIAFIASISNKTLITAMDPKESKDNIFTNIDSAVILD